MFSGDFIAECFRPDVRKICPPDFILRPQMRLVDVFQFADSMSLANVCCCFCVNDRHWLHLKTQDTSYCGPLSLLTLPMLLHTVMFPHCFCFGFLKMLSKSVAARAQLQRLTIASCLCHQPSLSPRTLSLPNSCPRTPTLESHCLSLSPQVPKGSLQFGKAVL